MKTFLTFWDAVLCHLLYCSGKMAPAEKCCILQAQTQVFVSPKHRTLSSSLQSAVSDSERYELASGLVDNAGTHGDLSVENVQNVPEIALSPVNRLVAGFKRFLFGSESDLSAGDIDESVSYKTEAWNIKTKLFCRVLALEDFSIRRLMNSLSGGKQKISDTDAECSSELASRGTLSCQNLSIDSADLLHQPTNVYVSIFTILSELPAVGLDSVPATFLATLCRLKSPSEKAAASRIQRAKSAHPDSEDVEENRSGVSEQRIIVRVIVTYYNSECRSCGFQFVQPVPQKHVLVSSLLRRQMNLSVTDKVALAPLCIPSDMYPTKINVYPLFSSVSCICSAYFHLIIHSCSVTSANYGNSLAFAVGHLSVMLVCDFLYHINVLWQNG